MKKYLMMGLATLVAMTMTSCLHVKIGDKNLSLGHSNDTPTQVKQVKEEVAMTPFHKVNVAGPFNVIYEQGNTYSVKVDGTAEQLEKMTIYVEDGELYIDQCTEQPRGTFDRMRVFVNSATINGIDVAGSGTVTVPNAIKAAEMGLEVSGSGKITTVQMTCTQLKIDIAGSGSFTSGPIQAERVHNEIAGSGNIDIAGLICKTVKNDIAGSGDVILNNLNVEDVKSNIAGSGNIILRGHAGTHKEDIAGSGKVDVSGLK